MIVKTIEAIKADPSVVRVSDIDIAEGVNYQGENCRVYRMTVYERMEAEDSPPDLGVHVQDGIKPRMERG